MTDKSMFRSTKIIDKNETKDSFKRSALGNFKRQA